MAITINQEPAKFTPAYNENWFVATTTNQAQANFKFVVDIVFLGDVSYTRRIKRNIYPGSTNKLVIDVHRIIENYLTHDIDLATDEVELNANSWKGYIIRVGEEYGTTPTVYPNLAQSNIILAWNAVQDFEQFVTYSSGTCLLGSSGSTFLTNSPAEQKVSTDEKGWLYMIQNPNGQTFTQAEVKTYNGNTLVQTVLVNNPYNAPASSGECFLRMPAAPASLNLITGGNLNAGSQPIIDSNITSYTIRTLDTGIPNGSSSETKTFKIVSNCTAYTKYRLHFLNRLGGFDSFSFIKGSQIVDTINKQMYKKPKGTLTGSSFGYDISDRLTTQYQTEVKTAYQINSDWITDEESEWLRELLSSPIIFWEKDGELLAVNITDVQYQSKKAVTDMTFNLTVTFETSYTTQLQRY
jgi:hypothetical protein